MGDNYNCLKHRTNKTITSGAPNPRGASLRKDGVNFTIYSRFAREIFLLLFDSPQGEPTDIININHRAGNVWHVYVHGIKAGQLYGYKVDGEYNPSQAMRFNKYKLLIDPYAKALTGKAENRDNLLFAYDIQSEQKDLAMDCRDNTHIVPKSIVVDDNFDWQDDKPPCIPEKELIIYEVHLKGFTAHPSSAVEHAGTYLGFIEKIPYLKELGINAVELLPIHEHYSSDQLRNNNLKEYWGYNSIGYFSPEFSYSTQRRIGSQVEEFKTLVRELHKANIEVILDVVYNHTGEGSELGPTLNLKGLDNSTFYALKGPPEEPYRFYREYSTGCGNILNIDKASVRHGVIDSLCYWVEHMHVDGFRFDLAPVLSREQGKFRKVSPFLKAVANDPILSRVKMIAEPWDLEGHHYGEFPHDWLEWNDQFRNTIRKFIKGDHVQLKELAHMLTGSQELSAPNNKKSINFVTCHDGFTLNDLFSYNHKHNLANGENNQDGSDHNDSWNCGVEGESSDIEILKLRKKMIKNSLCYLFFSFGTPMMLGGDELMHTQKGNNNSYCQDNEISWINWQCFERNKEIFEFCKKAIAFRKRYKVLQDGYFREDSSVKIQWFNNELNEPLWDRKDQKLLCYLLDDNRHNHSLLFIFNSSDDSCLVSLPKSDQIKWKRIIDTNLESGQDFLNINDNYPGESIENYSSAQKSVAVFIT
jgi:isoamylase